MVLSEAYANDYLNFLLGKTKTMTAPTQVWMALSATNPETGSFSEVTGNGYGRVLIAYQNQTLDVIMSAASGRENENSKQIVFPKATGAYTAQGWAYFTTETGGTPFAWGEFDNGASVSIVEGALPMFEIGAFGTYMTSVSQAAE